MKRLLVTALLLSIANAAFADTAVQFAAPGLRAPDDPVVRGLRFSVLHGDNAVTSGLDLGLFSLSETTTQSGFSAVLGICRVRGSSTGLASCVINVHEGRDQGVNASFANLINTMENGANVGFLNIAEGYTTFDLGGVNVSDRSAVQIGFLNVTNELTGLQFGFLNIAQNGFLPMFPIFNFPKN